MEKRMPMKETKNNMDSMIDDIVNNTIDDMANDISNILSNIPDDLLKDISKALRKQNPQKVRVQNYFYGHIYSCPCCDHFLTTVKEHTTNYCSECGQALDWSET